MLFDARHWPGLADGTITLAFRRWRKRAARPGGRQRFALGELAIDDVRTVAPDEITLDDARRAGFASRDELIAQLGAQSDSDIYRIELHFAGDDPRVALRERDEVTAGEVEQLRARLTRMDGARASGPWTQAVLRMIDEQPGVRAADLAAQLRRETLPFKADVRKLKELGLTESLEVGYRLSPRGRAALRLLS
jgi:hypothetical protein